MPSADSDDITTEDEALRVASAAIIDSRRLEQKLQSIPNIATLYHHLLIPTSPFADRILAILVRRCSEPLKLVRTVASQLRSSKAAAASPSRFIDDVFRPYDAVFDGDTGLRDAFGLDRTQRTVDGILGNYTAIISSVKKTEDLLRRHRKGKKNTFSLFGSAAATSDDNDEQRFTEQMLADIQALGTEARRIGVRAEDLPSYKEALNVIQRVD